MLADDTKLLHPIAYVHFSEEKVTALDKLPCCGENCYKITRSFFEKALQHKLEEKTTAG